MVACNRQVAGVAAGTEAEEGSHLKLQAGSRVNWELCIVLELKSPGWGARECLVAWETRREHCIPWNRVELEMFVRHCVGAENLTQVLCKSGKFS